MREIPSASGSCHQPTRLQRMSFAFMGVPRHQRLRLGWVAQACRIPAIWAIMVHGPPALHAGKVGVGRWFPGTGRDAP